MSSKLGTIVLRYIVALGSVVATTYLHGSLLSDFLADRAPFGATMLAVLVSAWFGGFGPGVFATLAGLLFDFYYFVEPSRSFEFRSISDAFSAGFYFLLGIAISAACEQMHRSRRATETAMEALRASEMKFRFMADSAPVLIWMSDAKKDCVWFNRAWLDFTGQSREQAFGDHWTRGIHPDDLTRCLHTYASHLSACEAFEMDYRLRRYDGEYRWILNRGVPFFDAAGQFAGFLGACVDITERRASESAGQRLAAIVESSNDAIVSKDVNGVISSWNLGAERLFGYRAEEIIGQSVTLLIPADRQHEEDYIMGRILRGERIENYETVRLRKDGTSVDVSLSVSPIKNLEGKIIAASKIARDISGSKAATEALAAHARRSEMLSTIAGELLMTESPRALLPSIFTRAASLLAAEFFFNYLVSEDQSELVLESSAGIPDSHRDLFSHLAFGEALCGTSAQRRSPLIINSLQECNLEAAMPVRQLGVRCYACHPLQVGNRLLGTISFASKSRASFRIEELRFMATVSDLVASSLERSRLLAEISIARDEAERASRAKDQFFAVLSHELRTPLSPILLVAGASADNPELPEKVRADFQMIRRNVSLEARLIEDLLDLNRIRAGKLQIERKPCDVHSILEDAILKVKAEIEQKCLVLKKTFQATECAVLGDPVRLQQIFWNILTNAVKFMPEEGQLSVATQISGDGTLSIRFADSGIGMSESELMRVFDAFAQGDHAEREGRGGLGLGLSIARRLVELHSGKIWAESPGSGMGSVFTVELPLLASKNEELRLNPDVQSARFGPAFSGRGS